ncbi:MAG: YlxR family protein [Mariprofundaceae bacterium]
MRRCIACRRSLPKETLLRLVVDAEGGIWPDVLQRAPGRGAYLCLRPECLRRMRDRDLRGVRGAKVGPGAWKLLRARALEALDAVIGRSCQRLRARAAIGRDAVMRRMWKNTPMLVLLARDAGEALRRQVRDALDKRRESGAPAVLIEVPSASGLGGWFVRSRVGVAALDDGPEAKKLKRFCIWHGCLNEGGVG